LQTSTQSNGFWLRAGEIHHSHSDADRARAVQIAARWTANAMNNLARKLSPDGQSPFATTLDGSTMDCDRDWEIPAGPRHVTQSPGKGAFPAYADHPQRDGGEAIVFIIDDDVSVREAIERLLRSVGLASEVFQSTREFVERPLPEVPCCLLLDIRLPGLSGLEFQLQLTRERIQLPIIFMTGHGDISMTVQAMKAGAVDFLTKPYREQDLLDAVVAAIERDRERRKRLGMMRALQQRCLQLTERERQVMPLVAAGLLNKQVAGELGLSEATVKIHRSSLMRKLHARTVPDLVRMADLLKEGSSPTRLGAYCSGSKTVGDPPIGRTSVD
jgi:FixJ family two-component response regulator